MLLETVSVEFCLLLSDLGIAAGAFGFDDGEGFPIIAPEDVIDEALAGFIGHSHDWKFAIDSTSLIDQIAVGERSRTECPASFFQEQVDKVIAGLGFGIVVTVDFGSVGGFSLSDFGA